LSNDQHSQDVHPGEEARPAELRYRVADFINDRIKAIPGLHTALKAALGGRGPDTTPATEGSAGAPVEVVTSPAVGAGAEAVPELKELVEQTSAVSSGPPEVPLAALPFPPLEMRELVGPTQLDAFDNPSGRPVYDYLEPSAYERVFDFGCGCGRVARQMALQDPRPGMYVGIDLHPGMIRWCQRNLQPVVPNFTFFHHDIYHVRFNPVAGKPPTAPFPVEDGQFTLVNALSVFTHLTQEHAVHYLRECARILRPDGVLHASWFFFDKRDYPMLHEHDNVLYVSYEDPGAAVIFDRDWVVNTAREIGLRVCKVVPPSIRGHQWAVIMTRRTDVEEAEFPPDLAPRGWAAPPMGSRPDSAAIGMEPDPES